MRLGRLKRSRRLWPFVVMLSLAACATPAPVTTGISEPTITAQDRRACPGGVVPAARIEFASRAPSYDNATPLTQLSNDAGLTVGRVALGVTEVKLSLSAQYRIRHAPALTEGVCAYPDDIVLRLSYAVRIVHVAREFANEPCLHAAILAHEMRHVALDDKLIPREITAFDTGLQARVGNGAGFWGADAAAADRRVDQVVTTAGAVLVKTLDDVRQREQVRQIDMPDEQPRIAAACGGRLNQLIGVAR